MRRTICCCALVAVVAAGALLGCGGGSSGTASSSSPQSASSGPSADPYVDLATQAQAGTIDEAHVVLREMSLLFGPFLGLPGPDLDAPQPRSATDVLQRVAALWTTFSDKERAAIEQSIAPYADAVAATRDTATTTSSHRAVAVPRAHGDDRTLWQAQADQATDDLTHLFGFSLPWPIDVEVVDEPVAGHPAVAANTSVATETSSPICTAIAGSALAEVVGCPRDIAHLKNCEIDLGPLFAESSPIAQRMRARGDLEPNQRSIVYHEVTHCYQFAALEAAGLLPEDRPPAWVVEGYANWVGEKFANGSTGQVATWDAYLAPDAWDVDRAIDGYSAIGFWAAIERATSEDQVYALLRPLFSGGITSTDAALQAIVANAPDVAQQLQVTWGPSRTQHPSSPGDIWSVTFPIAHVATEHVPQQIYTAASAPDDLAVHAGVAMSRTYTMAGDFAVIESITASPVTYKPYGGSNPQGIAGGLQPGQAAVYCLKAGRCDCPDGAAPDFTKVLTAAPPPAVLGATDEAYWLVALSSGPVQPAAARVSSPKLSDVCETPDGTCPVVSEPQVQDAIAAAITYRDVGNGYCSFASDALNVEISYNDFGSADRVGFADKVAGAVRDLSGVAAHGGQDQPTITSQRLDGLGDQAALVTADIDAANGDHFADPSDPIFLSLDTATVLVRVGGMLGTVHVQLVGFVDDPRSYHAQIVDAAAAITQVVANSLAAMH